MKRLLLLLMVSVLVIGMFSVVDAAQLRNEKVRVYVNGDSVVFPDQEPYIDKNDRTLVPIRFIAEKMYADVDWDGALKLVTIKQDDISICLTIGEKQAKVNGELKHFDTNAVIVGDRTMVPLRFISETLGAEVTWKDLTKSVSITAKLPKSKIGYMLPPAGQRQPGNCPSSYERTLALMFRHEYTYVIAQEWVDSLRLEDGYIHGRIPENMPSDLWFKMDLINGRPTMLFDHSKAMLSIKIQPGETFKYEMDPVYGRLTFAVGLRGSSEAKSFVGIWVPSGEIRWSNE